MPGNRLSEVHLQPKFAGVGADFGPAGKLSNFPDYPAMAGRDGNRRIGTGEARNKRRKIFFFDFIGLYTKEPIVQWMKSYFVDVRANYMYVGVQRAYTAFKTGLLNRFAYS